MALCSLPVMKLLAETGFGKTFFHKKS